MSDRFYVPEPLDQPTLTLAGHEARHLTRVLRKRAGEEIVVFDGQGYAARMRIDAIGQRTVSLSRLQPPVHRPTRGRCVILATAVPKGDRARWLVEKATELGAAAWIPLLSQRSVVDPREAKLEKLKQTVIAACKQSGRNDLMTIREPLPWTGFLDQHGPHQPLLVADPRGSSLGSASLAGLIAVTIAIGPEGGFTDAELGSARECGARLVSLGEPILRIETAAVAALTVLRLCSSITDHTTG